MLRFHHCAARHHHVVAFLIELYDLKFQFLAFEISGIAHRTHVHQRARQERAHAVDLDGEAALYFAGDVALDHFTLIERLLEACPGAGALGLLARQPSFAEAVLDGIQRNFDVVAHGDFQFAILVVKLFGGNHAF